MVHALTNILRRNGGYLSVAEMTRLLQGDLSTVTLEVLRELARVLGVKGGRSKVDLVTEIRPRVTELLAAPLTHRDLLLEAQKMEIPMIGFTYPDLRVLCGYDKIYGAGVVWVGERLTPLTTILTNTTPGSAQRLSRLTQDRRVMEEWNNIYISTGTEKPIYQALFARAITLTPDLGAQPLLYTWERDPVGYLLLESAPGSMTRQQWLQDYDPVLLQEFATRHGISTDLSLQVTLPPPDENGDLCIYYTHDRDPVTKALAQTRPNTLARYVALAPLERDVQYTFKYSLEDFCSLAQLEDQRPQYLPDYSPGFWNDLPLPVLQALTIREGIYPEGTTVTRNHETLLEQLELTYLQPTFFQTSSIENTTQERTTLHTELVDIPPAHRYAYGLREEGNEYHYFEREELRAVFTARARFVNPLDDSVFAVTAIRRLYILALRDTSDGAEEFRECLRTLLATTLTQEQEENDLCASLRNRVEILPALEALFELGMYMRRWDGGLARYPLTVTETKPPENSDITEENQHFTRVEAALERFTTVTDGLIPSLRGKIWSLPLRNYRRSGYYPPIDEEDGKTVRDRCYLVRQGNHPEAPMSSCVRLSSGWMLFTALYYYSKVFGGDLRGVRPEQIEFIS